MPPAAALPAFPRLFPRPGRCPNQREEDGGAHPPQPAGNRPGPALRRLSLGGVLKGGAGPRGPAAGSSSGGWGAGSGHCPAGLPPPGPRRGAGPACRPQGSGWGWVEPPPRARQALWGHKRRRRLPLMEAPGWGGAGAGLRGT